MVEHWSYIGNVMNSTEYNIGPSLNPILAQSSVRNWSNIVSELKLFEPQYYANFDPIFLANIGILAFCSNLIFVPMFNQYSSNNIGQYWANSFPISNVAWESSILTKIFSYPTLPFCPPISFPKEFRKFMVYECGPIQR